MNYPIDKYKFYSHPHAVHGGTEIIAVSTYAGKTVRGKATCHAGDTFSEESGKKLAALRCGAKIADKRAKRAEKCLAVADRELKRAQAMYNKMKIYRDEAHNAAADAHNAERTMLNSLVTD